VKQIHVSTAAFILVFRHFVTADTAKRPRSPIIKFNVRPDVARRRQCSII
jgi:hypothetical protein